METNPAPDRRPFPIRRLLLWLAGIAGIVLIWLAFNSLTAPDEAGPEASLDPPDGLTVSIQDGQVFNDPILTLTGSALPDQLIFVNGQPIPVGSDGEFELTLQLAEGPNLIQIESREAGGGTTSLVRQVVYTPPGEPAPVVEPQPGPSTGLLALALGVVLLAVVLILLRRRRPWVNVSTDVPALRPGPRGDGPVVTLIVELDRAARISLYLIDSGGRRVVTLLNNRRRSAGRLTFPFDGHSAGEELAAGDYRVRAEAGVPFLKSVAETELKIRGSES